MNTIINVAESLAELYDLQLQRIDIQYNELFNRFSAYVVLEDTGHSDTQKEFEVHVDGRFEKL